jgi:FkbH-like protein
VNSQPDVTPFATELAQLASAGDWEAAIALGARETGSLNAGAQLFVRMAAVLRDAQMIDAAESTLQEGTVRWPADVWLARELAELATHHRDFAEAASRWREMMSRHPKSPLGACGLAELHRQAGREEDAARLYAEAAQRYPDYVWANAGHAWTASRAADREEAIRRWTQVRQRFPDFAHGHEELVAALIAADRPADAAEAVRLGLMASPGSRRLEEAGERIRLLEQLQRQRPAPNLAVPDLTYRCPADLAVTPTSLRRVAVIGSCLVSAWAQIFAEESPGCETDYVLFNNGSVPPKMPPRPPGEYDFLAVQIPLRSVLPEPEYLRLSPSDLGAWQRLFDQSRVRLASMLWEAMRWNREHGILAFVSNFLVPQQNPMGRLLPRYDLRNLVYFVEKLNEALAGELRAYRNAYLFDHDALVANYGRRHMQDDQLWVHSHGAALADTDCEHDRNRLEKLEPATAYYPVAPHQFVLRIWTELQAMYRTIRQADMVKLVLIDLDDTLWRGVMAEAEEGAVSVREGWPFGFVEALLFLKKRGVLLGVVSKNDEDKALAIWRRIWGNVLVPEDFAVRKINWRPKADNIEEILAEVNLLPHSVLFIDDNPVERAAVQGAFPGMRVLGANPYLWRRILLWSAETQVPGITAESAVRTQMVQAQVERGSERKRMSREDFLASLELRASLTWVRSTGHPLFPRTLELINKTNQFNTTGRRWTEQEFATLFAGGGRVCTLDVTDKYTAHGIVGVLVVRGEEIVQFVMSCRVVGMDLELAAVSGVLAGIAATGHRLARSSLVETSANLLCRDLWPRCGFDAAGDGRFIRDSVATLPVPPHISMSATPAVAGDAAVAVVAAAPAWRRTSAPEEAAP